LALNLALALAQVMTRGLNKAWLRPK